MGDEISNYRKLQSLSRKKIMKWDKQKGVFHLRKGVDYKEIVKGLRTVRTDFDGYDLRKPLHYNTIRKIDKVMNDYFWFRERENVKEYRPRKKNKKLIANLAHQKGNWKVYFVPSDGTSSKITYKKIAGKKIAIEKTKVATYALVEFDMEKLAEDYEKECERITDPFDNIDYIRLMAGEKYMVGDKQPQYRKFGDIDMFKRVVGEFMDMYGNQSNNNFYENWMYGARIVTSFGGKKLPKKKRKK